ncbi:MAG: hypothetical protein K9H49_11690 [Bacteroidales bacterium]|nr:hypothetical protein [Bacteroidales bacterium]MCF8391346.1 hypothetical protein [Bacteroidales bacterium]
MKKILFVLLIFITFLSPVKSQETDLRELYLAAESYFLFEEFNEALPLYLRIHRHSPENDNVNYKIGVCFLNNPYEKDKSIMYLETAVKNINPKYKENNYKETGAPLESLFYLANAYRVNGQLTKAREYYKIFLSRLDPEIYDTDLVNEQLAACDAAENLIKKPVDFDFEILPEKINTRFADTNPVVSGDETKMAFISKLQFYDAVFYTEKENGEWKPARNIVPELGVDGDVYPTFLSYNGTELLVYRSDEYIGNIYYSRLVNDKWTPLQKLGENINTKYWESHASLSKDSKTLYFSSNRKGGYGGLDIYKSERQQNGDWGVAENLGPVINTKYNDDTPFITDDGEKLYFSSYGHYNMGGYDNFLSKKNPDGSWASPVNLGYPINTSDDDQFFLPLKSGAVSYSSIYSEQGFGKHDIVRYQLYTAENPRMFDISGLLEYMDGTFAPNDVTISVVESESQKVISKVNPNPEGEFSFSVPAGNYLLIFDSEKFNRYIQKLDVPVNSPHEGFSLIKSIPLELRPPVKIQKDISDYLSLREDSIINAEANETVKIRFNAEPGTFVNISVMNDSVLIYSDSILVDRKRQSFEFEPEPGVNKVTINLKDEEGNTTSTSLIVITKEDIVSIVDDVPNTDTEDTPISDQTLSEADALLNKMISNSDGNLKAYLESINTEALGLKTKEDLINYLSGNAENAGVSSSEINNILLSLGEIEPADIVIDELIEYANPKLASYLNNLNTEDLNINSADDLFKYLYHAADGTLFSVKDVNDLYKKYKTQENIESIVSELKAISDGNLKEILQNLDLKKEGIHNYEELINYLYTKVEEGVITEKDLLDLINNYSDSKTKDNSLQKKILEDERFRKLVASVGEDSINSLSKQQLYQTILSNPDLLNLDKEGLVRLLLELDSPDLDLLISGLKTICEKPVDDALDNLPDSVQTAEQLLNHLLKIADSSQEFDRDTILDAFIEYLENKDLYDYLSYLKKHSSGDLLEFLNTINIKNEGITGKNELLEYILSKASELNLSKKEIYRVFAAADNEMNIRNAIHKLIDKANPALREALINIIKQGIQITSLEDLISYLMENKDVYGYSETDVIELLADFSLEDNITIQTPEISKDKPSQLKQGVIKTILILLLEGLIIFILILLARRKKDKKED